MSGSGGEAGDVPARFLGGYPDLLRDATRTGRRPRHDELDALRVAGREAAEKGITLAGLINLYLEATERAWPALSQSAGDDTAASARALGSDVLAVLRRAVAAAADGHGIAQRLVAEEGHATRQQFIDDLLQGRSDPAQLVDRAERFGVLLGSEHVVIVARTERSFGTGDVEPRAIESALVARFGPRNVLVAVREGLLVCMVPSSLRGGSGEFVHQLVMTLGRKARWQVGVGRPHSGPGGVVKSYEEARGAIEFAQRLGLKAPVLNATDLLVFPVLMRDREAIVDLVTSVLGPLETARGGPRPFLNTLGTFFACQGNVSATARKLGVTSRAVVYRLQRLQGLTGYTPTEPTQRFTLEAAVLGARLLGWPEMDADDDNGLTAPAT